MMVKLDSIKCLSGAMDKALNLQSSIEGSSPTEGSYTKIFFNLFFRKNILKSPWPNLLPFSKIHFTTSSLHSNGYLKKLESTQNNFCDSPYCVHMMKKRGPTEGVLCEIFAHSLNPVPPFFHVNSTAEKTIIYLSPVKLVKKLAAEPKFT